MRNDELKNDRFLQQTQSSILGKKNDVSSVVILITFLEFQRWLIRMDDNEWAIS